MENKAAGPGAVEQQLVAPRPLLEDSTDLEAVQILNPLEVDFIGLIGQSRPVDVPVQIRQTPNTEGITTTEQDVKTVYGLSLKMKDYTAQAHITNKVVIPSKSTVNLMGGSAKVIVTQLVNEILQRRNQKIKLADPTARYEVEKEIILSRKSIYDVMGTAPMTVEQQMQQAVNKMNDEEAFPTEKKKVGRPPKDAEKTA